MTPSEQTATLPDDFDTAALERCCDAFRAIVPSMEGVRLIITSEFVKAVRDSHPDPEYAATYEQDRGDLGSAMAKVIPQEDGRIDVIIDSRILAVGQEEGVPERTFRHEAYHVALRQRGECLDFDRRPNDGAFAEANYLRTAEIACEEFRVEAPVCRDMPNLHHKGFPVLLAAVDGHIRQLFQKYARSHNGPEDVVAISRGVGEQFGSIVTASGYVAAVMRATDCGLPAIDPRIQRRVLGPYGAQVLEHLQSLPPADESADTNRLEADVRTVSDLLALWISDIGFRWEDMPNGETYFRVLKPAKWL